MPYYLFQISARDDFELVKQLELLQAFDNFKAAKNEARRLRANLVDSEFTYKVMFADSQLAAEEKLQEKREKPVLMEHER